MRRTFPRYLPAVLTVLLVSGLPWLVSGCGRSQPEEGAPVTVSDHFGKAEFFYDRGDYQQAAKMYLKALVINPANSEACLKLGLIYDDNLKDKTRAAYYYREFLRLEPDSEKTPLVRGWLGDVLAENPRGAGSSLPVRRRPPLTPPPPRPPATLSPAEMSAPTPAPPPAEKSVSASYTVRGGDTLAGIARKLYGDANAWKLIFEANRDQLESPHSLKVGQELEIPRNRTGD